MLLNQLIYACFPCTHILNARFVCMHELSCRCEGKSCNYGAAGKSIKECQKRTLIYLAKFT